MQKENNYSRLLDSIAQRRMDGIREYFPLAAASAAEKHIMRTACLFGNVTTMKLLIELGMTVQPDPADAYYPYALCLLDDCPWMRQYMDCVRHEYRRCLYPAYALATPSLKRDRLEILELLFQYKERMGFDPNRLLWYSILCIDAEATAVLKSHGAVIPDDIRESLCGMNRHTYKGMLENIISDCVHVYAEKALDLLEELSENCDGRPIRVAGRMIRNYPEILQYPELLERAVKCVDFSQVSRLRLMIENFETDMFPVYERIGWINTRKVRDAMIGHAAAENDTEAAAWLLDFKNRTADIEKERLSDERKASRLLNAAPDSVLAMKETWSFSKNEDGTLAITKLKRPMKTVVIPDMIGKRKVTAVRRIVNDRKIAVNKETRAIWESIRHLIIPEGITSIEENAFHALRNLEDVSLPSTLTKIGQYAFSTCDRLQSVSIPAGVKCIGMLAFNGCALKKVELHEGLETICMGAFNSNNCLSSVRIPRSVTEMDRWAFCEQTVLEVYRGSYAEKYCIKNKRMYTVID